MDTDRISTKIKYVTPLLQLGEKLILCKVRTVDDILTYEFTFHVKSYLFVRYNENISYTGISDAVCRSKMLWQVFSPQPNL